MPVQRVSDFDTWREGYAGFTVSIFVAGTTSLAPVFHDEALTEVAANPQTLSSKTIGARTFGKFSRPVYTASAYYIDAGALNQGGVQRPPLANLTGAVADAATVKATGGTVDRTLAEHMAQEIYAENYGAIAGVAATNTTTIAAAIGAASALGGGLVILPPGNIPFTTLSVPASVRLAGAGRSVTVLQSQEQDDVITLTGSQAGLERLTLDGISVQSGSVGVKGIGLSQPVMQDVEVKRFETGVYFKGCRASQFEDFYVTVCATNVKLHGDLDAGDTSGGSIVANNRWHGGSISFATVLGLDLSYEDAEVLNNDFVDVAITDNESAVRLNGARFTRFQGVWMSGNTKDFDVLDDDATGDVKNKVHGLLVNGHIDGGQVAITESAQDIVFDRCEIEGVEFALTLPLNPILLRDCIEDAAVTITGDGTKLIRFTSIYEGAVTGVTTDGVATEAWSVELEPGEIITLRAMVTANQRNGEGRAAFVIEAAAHRPGSTLGYGTQTANFTVGEVLTGATSGATGRIVADSDSGATGTLTLRSITGEFQNGEIITDGAGGSATAVGVLTPQNAVIGSQVQDVAYDPGATTRDAVFAVANGEVRLNVIGITAHTYDWNCHVQVVRNG